MSSEIIRLREAGLSRRAIVRALNCSRNIVDRHLEAGGEILPASAATAAASYRAPWSDQIDWDPLRRLAQLEGWFTFVTKSEF